MNIATSIEAPPDTRALTSLIRDYELGQLMPTPDTLAIILRAREQIALLAVGTLAPEVAA